jgi:hypothetical protein
MKNTLNILVNNLIRKRSLTSDKWNYSLTINYENVIPNQKIQQKIHPY